MKKHPSSFQQIFDWISDEPAFRGLWRSKLMKADGSFEEGWAVTFVYGGSYMEMEYQPTAIDAIAHAVELLEKLRSEEEDGTKNG